MEDFLRRSLGYKEVKTRGRGFFQADGKLIYVKEDERADARAMFTGQFESLKVMRQCGVVRVPEPIAVLDKPEGKDRGAMLVMEYLDMQSLRGWRGCCPARMHLHNIQLGEAGSPEFVDRFGFHMPTCCGVIPQGNEWNDSWPAYYENKLEEQMVLLERDYDDGETKDLWQKLTKRIPEMFTGIEIKPSLLHGDLWSGNTGMLRSSNSAEDGHVPVLIDPGCFYGHHEYDLGIAGMFGMSSSFFQAYHEVIPKAAGFEKRHKLYQLFHCLNHWNLFGGGYQSQSISIMRSLIK